MLKVYGAAPVLTVSGAACVNLRHMAMLRSELVRNTGFSSNSALDVVDATVQIEGCAILELPGTGLSATGESHVSVKNCLIANCWGKGVAVSFSERGSFEIVDSEIRNNQYSGLSISGPCKSIVVKRCRIHGTGWHGIRDDDCSPRVEEESRKGSKYWAHRTRRFAATSS
jgi:hypothetical protein